MPQTEIRIENARSHNLKGVSCRIPLRSLTVITGVSGSGKSTLAFDTLYAEGQRRYVSSLSTYARQFLERLPRPEVDSISNLPPAIAIEQRNPVSNARSTVGTATEILDHLRLLFARIGQTWCGECDRAVEFGSASGVTEAVLRELEGERVMLAAPLQIEPETDGAKLRDQLLEQGYTRVLDESWEIEELEPLAGERLEALPGRAVLLLDRVRIPDAASREQGRARVGEAVANAFARGRGELIVVCVDREVSLEGEDRVQRYREGLRCDGCGRAFPKPVPQLFSFNSPLGACQECQGFGRVQAIDTARVIPDPSQSLADVAIAPFTTRMGARLQQDLMSACASRGVRTDVAFEALSPAERSFVMEGDEAEGGEWYGVSGFFRWLERRRYKVEARTLIARYRRFDRCPACAGARLGQGGRSVRLRGRHIGEVSGDSVEALGAWLDALSLTPDESARVGRVLEALQARVATVDTIGLGYVSLDRQVRTLSGGEAQRIQLATALSGRLTSTLYILDEPSIGLHARDVSRLVEVLATIRGHGNTVVVVEHAPEVMRAADHLIDLGPAAGRHGGERVAEGTVAEVARHEHSQTARVLRGEIDAAGRSARRSREARGVLRIVGAREHNLQDLTVELPLGQLVVVTGVSGAGKSTLVHRVLVDQLLFQQGQAEAGQRGEPGLCERIEGAHQVSEVVLVDQRPATRSPRSNPATVSKAFDPIRALFAGTREAKAQGLSPGWFSFNVAGGRCEVCEGAGEVIIDMQFLDDVRAPCEECNGLRYRRDVLQIRVDGRSITDVLDLTIDEACSVFAAERKILSRLEPLRRTGLGYLQLGQPLSTLSGGEHQRVRLARAIGASRPSASGRAAQGAGRAGPLYVLDEPTTGLHPVDIHSLLEVFEELIDAGGSLVVVEHDLDVIARADFVLDLGPEGGPGGGRIVAAGTPEEIARTAGSHTGAALAARSRLLGVA